MKRCKQLLSVLLACVFLFGTFSTSVLAGFTNTDIKNDLYWRYSFFSGTWTYRHRGEFHPVGFTEPFSNDFEWHIDTTQTDKTYFDAFEFNTTENWDDLNTFVIFDKGESFTLSFDGFESEIEWTDTKTGVMYHTVFDINGVTEVFFQLFDYRGNYVMVNPTYELTQEPNQNPVTSVGSYGGRFTVDSVPFDVYKFRLCIKYDFARSFNYGSRNEYFYRDYGFHNGTNWNFTLETENEETGFFRSIINWLKEIKDKLVNGFSELANNISQLPTKIWTAISNGLKDLFVPDEQYITDYSNNWDDLLSLRFGAIYEVGGLLVDMGKEILTSLKDNNNDNYYIEFPVVDLPVGSGETFSFGGWKVKLKMQELSIVYDGIKFISAVGVTLLFLNGMRKRYDEVMGVEH